MGKLEKLHRLQTTKAHRAITNPFAAYVKILGCKNSTKTHGDTLGTGKTFQAVWSARRVNPAIQNWCLSITGRELNINDVFKNMIHWKETKKYYVPLDYYYQLVDYRRIDTLHPPPRCW